MQTSDLALYVQNQHLTVMHLPIENLSLSSCALRHIRGSKIVGLYVCILMSAGGVMGPPCSIPQRAFYMYPKHHTPCNKSFLRS